MSKEILVPLGGSELSERALPFAQRIARASRAKILLFHAVQAAYKRDAYPCLERVCGRCKIASREVVRVVHYVQSWEDAAGAILQAARDREVDLIVMSTTCRSPPATSRARGRTDDDYRTTCGVLPTPPPRHDPARRNPP